MTDPSSSATRNGSAAPVDPVPSATAATSPTPATVATPSHTVDGTLPGRLFYVVGPSGVGKDALLAWARERIESRKPQTSATPSVFFARRTITRPPHPSEDHEPIDALLFQQQADAGAFAILWQANGVRYGIRRGIEADLAAGRHVVVNGSREHVPRLKEAFPDATIVWITADADTVARRLAGRQRETGAALQERVMRGAQFAAPADTRTVEIDNSGVLEVAGEKLMALLTAR